MRELTKALGSFSMAMSAFGAQQVANLLRRAAPGTDHPAAAELDSMARATEQLLGDRFRDTYAAGDRAQRSAVDMLFGAMDPDRNQPQDLMAMGNTAFKEGVSAFTHLFGGQGGCCGGHEADCQCRECQSHQQSTGGWGPMPPLR